MIKLEILHVLTITTSCFIWGKIKNFTIYVMRSNPAHRLLSIFRLENILRSNLNFSTSYGPSTDLKSLSGLLLVSFIGLGEKISLKYLLIGGAMGAYVQTG